MNNHTATKRGIVTKTPHKGKGPYRKPTQGYLIKDGASRPAVKTARGEIIEVGVEGNRHTDHDNEVKFENIRATANVTKEVLGNKSNPGVVKGSLLAGVPLTVTQNSPGAIAHAMKKRCDYPVNNCSSENFLIGHHIMMDKVPELETMRIDQELIDRYFKHCGPVKAGRLVEALRSDEWNLDGGNAMKHVFAKMETLVKPHGAQPRVVYQATDMYNALVGVVVFELQNRMQQVFSRENPLNKKNTVIYAPGAGSREIGACIEEAEGEVLESDFKSNDATQNGAWRKHEAMFYMKLGAPQWFVRAFAKQTTVRVWTRVGLEATVQGQRWSGEATTTTGNTYVGACQIQSALSQAGVEDSMNIHGGDDYLGVINAPGKMENVLNTLVESVSKTGMNVEAFLPKSKDHATFYQKRYVHSYAVGGRAPVPRFGRVLAKLNVRANRNTQVGDREYMAGKYLSAAYEHRYVPVIRDVLAETAMALSPHPFIDGKDVKKVEGGDNSSDVEAVISATVPHDVDTIKSFVSTVYDVSFDDVVSIYREMARSALDYCAGWTTVGRDGKSMNKDNSFMYQAKYIDGDTVDALVAADIG